MESSLLLSLKTLLAPYAAPWWVAGGWAVDAHVGQVTRQHDADVLVLQRDLHLVAATFPDVYAEVPGTGERLAWDSVTMLDPGPQALGLNVDLGDGISKVQLLIALADGRGVGLSPRSAEHPPTAWFHRSDHRRRRSLPHSRGRPSVQVARAAREGHRRLRCPGAALSYYERHWLRERIRGWRPDHPWLRLFTDAASQ